MFREILSDGWKVLTDPIGFFEELQSDNESEKLRNMRRPILFLIVFLVVYCVSMPLWIVINDWVVSISEISILDFHYGNQVFLSMHKDWYPLFYSHSGSWFVSWLMCIPIIILDTVLTALFFALVMHLAYKHVLKGTGHYRSSLAGVCYGDLPSLLFGFIPFSAAVGLLWTGFLQFSATARYLYGISWNKALIPLVFFGFLLVIGWSLFGTVSPPGFLDLIPTGPYEYP
ncbi:MAG: hypothetical protein ACFE7R_03630 [Candidatus Hodarchaeota archaeon]